jgi:hypothetical protein
MTAMSRTVKSAIFYSAIGIAAGVGIILIIAYSQTVRGMFQHLVGEEDDDSSYPNAEETLGSVPTLRFLSH